jgi:hypothetical protein
MRRNRRDDEDRFVAHPFREVGVMPLGVGRPFCFQQIECRARIEAFAVFAGEEGCRLTRRVDVARNSDERFEVSNRHIARVDEHTQGVQRVFLLPMSVATAMMRVMGMMPVAKVPMMMGHRNTSSGALMGRRCRRAPSSPN